MFDICKFKENGKLCPFSYLSINCGLSKDVNLGRIELLKDCPLNSKKKKKK